MRLCRDNIGAHERYLGLPLYWDETLLKVWDLKNLGLQAAQRIAKSSDPLRSLADLSQNFPNLVSSLSKSKVDDFVKQEVVSNQKSLPGGRSSFSFFTNVKWLFTFISCENLWEAAFILDVASSGLIPVQRLELCVLLNHKFGKIQSLHCMVAWLLTCWRQISKRCLRCVDSCLYLGSFIYKKVTNC